MVLVYYSHLGEDQLKNVEWPENFQFSGKISQLIDTINGKYPGFKNCILDDNGKILSSVRIYKNVVIDSENRILDGNNSKEIKKIEDENSKIIDSDNLLFSSYDPRNIGKLLDSVLVHSPGMLNTKHQNRDEFIENEYSTFLGEIKGPTEEIIYEFKNGECTLKELEIKSGKSQNIELNETTDLFNIFNRKKSSLLPSALVDGIVKILDLPSKETRLRAHQEDALFYISGKLQFSNKIPFDALLLSIPTGGGKTEAFLIPIVSHIFNDKMNEIKNGIRPESRIRTIITYPTKALANDQANRIVEILHSVNKQSTPDQKISLGILTGDTPSSGGWKLKKSNLIQLCPECKSANFDYPSTEIGEGRKINLMECKHCGAKLDFLRLTREDILTDCPDILITNLDEINYCLQSKRYRPLFSNKIDLMVFDEIHLCESVFGCHTSHLLRRLEAASGYKPLYIGVSATIQNAEDLASLIFDVDKEKILFLRHQTARPYLTDQPNHYRYHYVATPKIAQNNRYYQVLTSTIRTTDALGHSIIDPHFRKTLVFCNYRQDTDKYITYMQNQQERYFDRYADGIRQKIILGQKITKPELEIARDIGGYYEFLLSQKMLFNASLKIGWHRGGLEQEEQLRAITRFSTSQAITWEDQYQELPVDIMVATKTLELGIDIGDVSNVFNTSAPFTVNEYVQRIGRGGRKKDSSAITVLDPLNPLDFYFQNHFNDYVIPENRKFEDAPIIITNQSILKNHIYARILDFIVENLQKSYGDVKVDELSKLKIHFNGEVITLIDNPDLFAEAVFNRFFIKQIVDINGQEISAFERFQEWIKRESILLQVKVTNISQEDIKKILIEKCREISEKINSTDYPLEAYISGFSGKDQSLVPKLRGSGASCNIILVQGKTDKVKDNVTRRRAISSMPKGGFSSQGANSFIVYDYDLDSEIQRKVRTLFGEKPDAWKYFKIQFGEKFPKEINNIELRTPKNLKVKYFPYRFYCPKCGKMYQGPTNNDRCSEGCGEIRQITELFICGECGKVYEPPVPMVCINPNHLAHEPEFIESLNSKKIKTKYEIFRFNALPKLRWQCKNKKCGAIFDFYNRFSKQHEFPKSFMDKRPIGFLDYKNPEDVAKHYEYLPESSLNKPKYEDEGFLPARYACTCGARNKIRPKNIPTVRSIVVEFILWDYELMSKLDLPIGRMEFRKVDVIDLAREYSMRFYKMSFKNSTSEINKYEIFKDDPQTYLANTFGTHAASFNIDKSTIEKFIDTQQECLKGKCRECKKIECVDNFERTRPTTELEKIELEKTPDVRRKWCSLSRRRECAYQDKVDCSECKDFLPRDFLKYILLHTLKHAIILALPKYTGINKNEVRGIIYPNDEQKPELVFLDVHEDGSGSIYLMKRNWKNIWALSEEVMNNSASGKGTLMLTHFCERNNKDLCPVLGSRFFAFLRDEGLNIN